MQPANGNASRAERGPLLLLVGSAALFGGEAHSAEQAGWRVITARDGFEAQRQLSLEAPALLVVSFDLPPGPHGLDGCRSLKELSSSSAVIVLVGTGAVEARLSAFEADADDCIEHSVDVREFVARANALLRRCALPPLFLREGQFAAPDSQRPALAMNAVLDRVSAFSHHHGLSPQQKQILGLLASGLPLKLIGARIGCEHSTVRTHLHRMALKLGCSGSREILARLLSCDPA